MDNIENKVEEELSKLEKESEEFLQGIDINNLTDEQTEHIQVKLEEMFGRIQSLLEQATKKEKNETE
jgi:hypothetical protein